jgi:hypothetical protein
MFQMPEHWTCSKELQGAFSLSLSLADLVIDVGVVSAFRLCDGATDSCNEDRDT